MLSLILCALAFIVTRIAARRSLVSGLIVLFAVGYVYGIVRANVLQPLSHFIFDASLGALYVTALPRLWRDRLQPAMTFIRTWFLFLVGWPLLLSLVPVQDYLVQLVGFRGNVYFLPMLLIGASMQADDFRRLALWLAGFNVLALAVAAVEFVVGIEPFFPQSAVTEIMYRSRDVGAEGNYRIPSTFTSAHAFAGTMVGTIPLVFGTWTDAGRQSRWRPLLLLALLCAGVGVFMAAARQPVIMLGVVLLVGLFRGGTSARTRIGGIAFVLLVVVISLQSERLQRFRSLGDTDAVSERVEGSVNATLVERAFSHPMGNGIGGGGTSMPYFLADRLRDPVVIENEYGRVMLEQGIAGLIGFAAFLFSVLTTALRRRPSELQVAQRMAFGFVLASCISGAIGLGMLTSIPGSAITLLLAGWMLRLPEQRPSDPLVRAYGPAAALRHDVGSSVRA